jgi:hypothetical protein
MRRKGAALLAVSTCRTVPRLHFPGVFLLAGCSSNEHPAVKDAVNNALTSNNLGIVSVSQDREKGHYADGRCRVRRQENVSGDLGKAGSVFLGPIYVGNSIDVEISCGPVSVENIARIHPGCSVSRWWIYSGMSVGQLAVVNPHREHLRGGLGFRFATRSTSLQLG